MHNSSFACALVDPVPPAAPPPSGSAVGTGTGGTSTSPFGGNNFFLLMMIGMLALLYFTTIRPQQQKAKDLESKLKKGDRVFTKSGIIGKIVELSPHRATLEIAPNVKVQMLRTSIEGLDEGETTSSKEEKSTEAKK